MRVLVVGQGSIGVRHSDNFKSIGCEVGVVSRRKLDRENCFPTIREALTSFAPTHVVIANETVEHERSLEEILSFDEIQRVLVEKPLFSRVPSSVHPAAKEKVRVAYQLRFHPLIGELRRSLGLKKIIGWHAYVGQHLASWRPQRDYRKVYSAHREQGGGVLRDLSHELDLFHFLAGKYQLLSCHGGHFSTLETDAEDTFSILLSSENCTHGNIHMNCIDRLGQRFLTVHTEDESYHLDFVAGTFRSAEGVRNFVVDRNAPYLDLSRAFLEDDSALCSFEQGLETNRFIEEMEAL